MRHMFAISLGRRISTSCATLLLLTVTLLGLVGADASTGGIWQITGNMDIGRAFHTATLLPTGDVLVTGNCCYAGSKNTLPTAQLYDPHISSWTATNSMLTNRSDHTATLLLDGKVLIAGGMNQHSLASAELYDPNTGTWTETGSMMVARAYHTATLLPSGKVLVAGGATCDSALHCTYLASAELYDPQTGTWASAGRMHDARITHTATLLSSGKVLVVGGYGADNTSLGGELYDPRTDAWVATSAMIANRSFHTATLLPNRQVLVAGGCLDADCGTVFSSAELYDPATNMWTATSSMTMARAYHTATLLTDGRVLVTGGEDRSSAELYSPDIRRWTATSSMASDRHSQTATLLSDGQVLVVGGLDDDNTALSSAELYVPRSPLLPLTIRIPAYAVLSDGPLPLSLTTTPGALVIITLRIRSGNGAILYRTGFQGIADVQGHFTHALGCAYLPTKPVPAILTVTVRTGRGAATKTVTVTLAH